MFYFFYFLPLSLDVSRRGRAWGTWGLLSVCVGLFLYQQLDPYVLARFYDALVFVPARPNPIAIFGNAYLHAGWLHLGFNMMALFVFGPALESRLGTGRFLFHFHLLNAIANLVQGGILWAFLPEQIGYGIVGASGAIAGLVGVFSVRLYFARLRVGYWAFLPLQAYTRAGVWRVPVLFAILFWFGMQCAMGFSQANGADLRVAWGSHLGGLLGGIGLALWMRLDQDATAEHHFHRGQDYVRSARWYAAQGEFTEYVRRQPEDEKGHLELARTYRLNGMHAEADAHYRAACELEADRKRMDHVEVYYREALRGNVQFVLSPVLQLRLARLLERVLKPADAEVAYRSYAAEYPDTPQAVTALCCAARLAAQDPDGGLRVEEILERLRKEHPLVPETTLALDPLASLHQAA